MGCYSQIMTALLARLAYHTASGRMLAGVNFQAAPIVETDGEADIPKLNVYAPMIHERPQSGDITKSTLTVGIMVRTLREKDVVNLIELVETVLDAIQTTHDGSDKVDPTLAGTISSFSIESDTSKFTDLTISNMLMITMAPSFIPTTGKRHDTSCS